jgi:hypothetical protein
MKKVFWGMLILIFLSDCRETFDHAIPNSSGSPGSILVVMDEQKWKGEAGDSVRSVFLQEYSVLPQPEPCFDISQIPEEAFSRILMQSRNIFIVEISVNVARPQVTTAYDLYSTPQVVITVRAKNIEEFIDTFNKNSERILRMFENAEKERLIKAYSSSLLNKKVKSDLEKSRNYSMSIPNGYNLDINSAEFVWISRETPSTSQGILIWEYPYIDSLQMKPDQLMNTRDEITKKHVPGPVEGTYMTIERLLTPEYSRILLNKVHFTKLKGLWKVTGSPGVFMGGPFVSFTTVDKKRNRIITADGYVYGGDKKKRELIRQVEAILTTFKIVE